MTDQPTARDRPFARMMLWAIPILLAAGVVLWTALAGQRHATPANDQAASAPPPRLQRVGDAVAVVLDSVALRHAHIETHTLRTMSVTGTARLTGELVADPARVTSLRAGLAGRLTDAGGRWPSLGERIAAGTILGQVSDAELFSAPRAGIVTRVGAQPGEIVQAGQELIQLTDLSVLIARIAWPLDAPTPAPTITVSPLVGPPSARSSARLIGPAADVDSVTRRPIYLYQLAHTWPGARVGLAVAASVPQPGNPTSGVLVPVTAVVQWQGLAWVFVERGPGQFVRVRIDTSHPVSGGWMVPVTPSDTVGKVAGGEVALQRLAADDHVVVRGAAQLLSEEFRSRLPEGYEDGD